MSFWSVLSYAAWAASAVILIWMVVDMIKVSKEHDEDYLLSSREGEDILMQELEEERDE